MAKAALNVSASTAARVVKSYLFFTAVELDGGFWFSVVSFLVRFNHCGFEIVNGGSAHFSFCCTLVLFATKSVDSKESVAGEIEAHEVLQTPFFAK